MYHIKVMCITNLDDFKREEWPKEFAYPPRVGERVEAKSGAQLKIVSITHKLSYPWPGAKGDPEPFIIVELNK